MKHKPGPVRVLVADDSALDRELAMRQLGPAWPFAWAMEVECAGDGHAALTKLASRQFALAVLDWNMPRLDGREVLRQLRADGLRLPVVVVSGQRHEELAPHLTALAAAFVHKDELTPIILRRAITASLALPGVQWMLTTNLDAGAAPCLSPVEPDAINDLD